MLEWFDINFMQANPSKFQYIVFSKKQEKNLLCLNAGEILQPQECVKLLGIIVDFRLNFNQHISYLCKKAARGINALSRISGCLDYTAKILWRPLVGASGSSWCVGISRGLSLCCLGGFGSSPRLLRRLHVPGPRSVIFWTFLSRARPSLRHAPRLPLLQSILQRRFRSTAGAAIPLSSLSLALSRSLSLSLSL